MEKSGMEVDSLGESEEGPGEIRLSKCGVNETKG